MAQQNANVSQAKLLSVLSGNDFESTIISHYTINTISFCLLLTAYRN